MVFVTTASTGRPFHIDVTQVEAIGTRDACLLEHKAIFLELALEYKTASLINYNECPQLIYYRALLIDTRVNTLDHKKIKRGYQKKQNLVYHELPIPPVSGSNGVRTLHRAHYLSLPISMHFSLTSG